MPATETKLQTGPIDQVLVDPGPREEEPTAPAQSQWNPDLSDVSRAAGDPHPWAHLIHEMVGHITGQWIDESSIEGLLESYSIQVATAVNRSAIFDVANTPLPTHVDGDAAVALLNLRDEIAQGFKHKAGR